MQTDKKFAVIILTLSLSTLLGCASLRHNSMIHNSSCSDIASSSSNYGSKTHAYVKTALHDYLSQRYSALTASAAPIRVAVVPFTTPANFSGFGSSTPNIGLELATQLQAQLLRCSKLPIVEVLNRADWPGKREEFFTGNFGAISQAREAGYDLIILGLVENQRSLDQLVTYTKVIEADAGITLWYGRTAAMISKPQFSSPWHFIGLDQRRPDLLYSAELLEKSVSCITEEMIDPVDRNEECLPDDNKLQG